MACLRAAGDIAIRLRAAAPGWDAVELRHLRIHGGEERHFGGAHGRFTGFEVHHGSGTAANHRRTGPYRLVHDHAGQELGVLHGLGARTQLIPGDPLAALACSANSLPDTDLLIIRADQLGESMEQAWYYVPRMLHTHSLVLVEQADREGYEVLLRADVQRKARAIDRARRSVARRSVARRSAA